MRICLLGDCTGRLDEGMKNTTHNLYQSLGRLEQTILVRPKSILSPTTLSSVLRFNPDIFHYTMGPTWRSFAVVRLVSLLMPEAVVVMSSPRPEITPAQIKLLMGYRPSMLLTQSSSQMKHFGALGFRTELFPSGVDLDKFRPISPARKQELRQSYGFPPAGKIAIHVGQITAVRELDKLIPMTERRGWQLVVVAASTIPPDQRIVDLLEKSGCRVILEFVDKIEEYYQLADCFVFPGTGSNSAIEMPLSVLEAMACNLPIITGRFGGLPDFFGECDGFHFAENSENILSKLYQIEQLGAAQVGTRQMVERFSWDSLAQRLVKVYRGVIEERSV